MSRENLTLDDLCELLPEELVERHGLEDLPEDVAKEKALKLINLRAQKGYSATIGYHTSDFLFDVGDKISPELSNDVENIVPEITQSTYRGKIFFSRNLETAYIDDNPRYCYKILVHGKHADPEDLTGKDWFYTLTPAKVLEVVPLSEVYAAKRKQ
jgi:hypothetical protein